MANSQQTSLNVTKTEFLLIGSNQMLKSVSNHQTNISIAENQIKQVSDSKTLGIIVDEDLNWKSQHKQHL